MSNDLRPLSRRRDEGERRKKIKSRAIDAACRSVARRVASRARASDHPSIATARASERSVVPNVRSFHHRSPRCRTYGEFEDVGRCYRVREWCFSIDGIRLNGIRTQNHLRSTFGYTVSLGDGVDTPGGDSRRVVIRENQSRPPARGNRARAGTRIPAIARPKRRAGGARKNRKNIFARPTWKRRPTGRARARDRDRAGLVLGACALGGMDEVDGVGWTVENAHALVARATATTATTVTTATTASEGNIFSRTRRVVLRRIIARARERPMFLYVMACVYKYVLCQLLSLCMVKKIVKICRHTDASRARVSRLFSLFL